MAYSLGTHIQVPASGTAPHTEIQRSDTAGEVGFAVIAQAAQFLYGRKLPPAVLDWSAVHNGVWTAVGGAKYWNSRFARQDAHALTHQVWIYVVRNNAHPTSDWQIKASNITAGTSVTAQVNGGSTTAGTWWNLGSLSASVNGSYQYSKWKIECTVATGLGSTSRAQAVAILPDYSRTALANGATANGVRFLNITHFAASEEFLATWKLANVHTMLIQTWRESVGNFLTRALAISAHTASYNAISGSSYGLMERSWLEKPVNVGTAWFTILPSASGTVVITIGSGPDQATATVSVTSGTWAIASVDVSAVQEGVPIELRIKSTADFSSISGFWRTPSYP